MLLKESVDSENQHGFAARNTLMKSKAQKDHTLVRTPTGDLVILTQNDGGALLCLVSRLATVVNEWVSE